MDEMRMPRASPDSKEGRRTRTKKEEEEEEDVDTNSRREKKKVFRGASSRRESVKLGDANPKVTVSKGRSNRTAGPVGAAADGQYVIVVSRIFFCWTQQHRQMARAGRDRTKRCRYLSTAYPNKQGQQGSVSLHDGAAAALLLRLVVRVKRRLLRAVAV